jgi:hypothetical protein
MVAGRMMPFSIVGLLTFVLLWFTFGWVCDQMKTRLDIFLLLAALGAPFWVFGSPCFGQEDSRESLSISPGGYQLVLADVELGISTGDVSLLAKHFAPQVGINIREDESGTFSANQTYYVIQDFFRLRKFGRFAFSTVGGSETSPYGTGSAEFAYKGTRSLVQVYLALTLVGEKYVITQLTIY